jgi:hypothetical protein
MIGNQNWNGTHVCFCLPLETYHILLSSITVYYAALIHLNGGVKQLAKAKMHKLDNRVVRVTVLLICLRIEITKLI